MKNKSIEAYKQGSYYENFMCRAFRTSDNSKPGMHGSAMQNLIDAENGETILIDFLGSYEEQLGKVKKYMHTALDKFLKMKLNPDSLDILTKLKAQVNPAKSTTELMQIVEKVMDVTQSVKNY